MGLRADEVFEAGLALDLDDRAVVAHRLLATLHSDDDAAQAEVDAAWRDEIDARVDEVLDATVELVDFEATRERARAIVADHRG